MREDRGNSGNRKAEWLGAIAVPAAIIASFLLTTQFDIDWWEAFTPTLMLFGLAEWLWRWFTAPEEMEATPDFTPPDTIVPREAKIGMLAAGAIVGSLLLLMWAA